MSETVTTERTKQGRATRFNQTKTITLDQDTIDRLARIEAEAPDVASFSAAIRYAARIACEQLGETRDEDVT
jgi:hypothetical protein